ncbi:hypothetical protein [Dyella silvatica]|uniref:hypothetical protein n=1 Tax=Dyella silvatica TaxID=2992128 RepID=UPI00224D5661|nr:hypothetical protein [Dyella silvatica]
MQSAQNLSVEELTTFLMMLLNNSPMLIAAVVGAIIAMVMWQRAPRAALLTLIACSIQLLSSLINTWIYGWYMPHAMHAEDQSHTAIQLMIGVWGLCNSLMHVIMMALLIWAVFSGRPKPTRRPPALP